MLARRLDSQTAFEIVSIDIADVDVGDNIGARLQADQSEAAMRVARANAEGRRAMAVAREQEMIAQIEESRAKLVEAEAEVPKAIADAIRERDAWRSWIITSCGISRPIPTCGGASPAERRPPPRSCRPAHRNHALEQERCE